MVRPYIPKDGTLENIVTDIFLEKRELSKSELVEEVRQKDSTYTSGGILRCASRLAAKGCLTSRKDYALKTIFYKIVDRFEKTIRDRIEESAKPIQLVGSTYRKPFTQLNPSRIPAVTGSREGSNEFRKIKSKFNE